MSSVRDVSRPPREFTRIRPQPRDDHDDQTNLEGGERIVSLVAGLIMISGLLQQSWIGAVTAAIGVWLVYRGATGHCPVCALIATRADEDEELDEETEA